jgi:cytochrome c-type biogenesis protein CcmH/NrfG
LPQAISHCRRATAIDPEPARYWLDLAEAYETADSTAQAKDAFREARRVYPISADGSWRRWHFRSAGALPTAQDIGLILRTALPADPEVDWEAIQSRSW